jgi:hypothetical protein
VSRVAQQLKQRKILLLDSEEEGVSHEVPNHLKRHSDEKLDISDLMSNSNHKERLFALRNLRYGFEGLDATIKDGLAPVWLPELKK